MLVKKFQPSKEVLKYPVDIKYTTHGLEWYAIFLLRNQPLSLETEDCVGFPVTSTYTSSAFTTPSTCPLTIAQRAQNGGFEAE